MVNNDPRCQGGISDNGNESAICDSVDLPCITRFISGTYPSFVVLLSMSKPNHHVYDFSFPHIRLASNVESDAY